MSDEPEQRGVEPPEREVAPPGAEDAVEAAWTEVESHWGSAEAHKRFLVLADSLGRLAEAGRRYRDVKERDPARRADAEKRIEELLGFAMARVRVDKVEPGKARSRIEWVALGVSLVLIVAALRAMMQLLGG